MAKKTVFTVACRLPVIGRLLLIGNSYVYDGDPLASSQFADISKWIRGFVPFFAIAAGLTELVLHPDWISASVAKNLDPPAKLLLNVFPNLVGFGIGSYALIFTIPANLVQKVNDAAKRAGKGSGAVINGQLGFPLLVLVLSIGIAAISQFSEGRIATWISWFCFWYSWLMVVEVVYALFKLGDALLALHIADDWPKGK